MITRKTLFLVSISASVSSLLLAAEAVPNWPAPAFWSPPKATRGATTLSSSIEPRPFVAVTPCRQYDSRSVAALADNTNLAVTLTGAPCGLPSAAQAVSLNITVFDISGAGSNGVFRVGTANDPTTAWINYPPTETQRANAGVVPLNASGQVVVKVNQGSGSVDFTVDVNGYYASDFTDPTQEFVIATASNGPSILAINSNPACTVACGILGETASTSGAIAIDGFAYGTTGVNYGARGISVSDTNGATGVYGHAQATTGIVYGVQGVSDSTTGGATGVVGSASATAGVIFGVQGFNNSGANDSAGVLGYDTGRAAGGTTGVFGKTGVRGESFFGNGVLGLSNDANGVAGFLLSTTGSGAVTASGTLGSAFGTAADTAGPPWGVFAGGNLGATGAKHFVEPDPNDPTRVIVYSSLEGPEVGTYFRGTAEVVNHQAIIDVPEDFRTVTADNGLTVQLTPIGASSNIYVESRDLNRIVVRASKDVTFDYLVQGVRRAFKDFQPARIGYEFMPRSPADRMQPYLTEEAKRRLIANGTYNPDGTVNMRTAERVGWTKIWADREAQAKAEAAEKAKKNVPAPR